MGGLKRIARVLLLLIGAVVALVQFVAWWLGWCVILDAIPTR